MAKVQIVDCYPAEGPLYAVAGEDSELHCFRTSFVAVAKDGKRWMHSSHYVPGHYVDEEGFAVPNRSYRSEADTFCAKVADRGVIDTRYWVEVVEPAEEELRARLERDWMDERDGLL